MKTYSSKAASAGYRLAVRAADGRDIAHCYLYVLKNDLHPEPFGLIEDVQVDENARSKGLGSRLVGDAVRLAEGLGCYKVILTSRDGRPEVHDWYRRLGFAEHGREFRMDLSRTA